MRKPQDPFTDLPRTAKTHFKLYFFAAVSHLTRQLVETFGTYEAVVEQFPFLQGYSDELAGREHPDCATSQGASDWWSETIRNWEELASVHLPLRALREACSLDHQAMMVAICAGLVEEDSRFGLVFEALQGTPGQHRPNFGLISAWWRCAEGYDEVRARLRRLHELGLVRFINTDLARAEWSLQSPAILWDAMRGEVHERIAPWAGYCAPEKLASVDELVASFEISKQLSTLPAVLASGRVNSVIIRGARHNGRKTLLGALARALGRGLLEISDLSQKDDERWRLVGPLATLLHALPAIVLDPAPGETVELAELMGYLGPRGLVLGKQGGASGGGVDRAITLTVEMPDAEARRTHWQRSLAAAAETSADEAFATTSELDAISERYRITSGNIRRVAHLAFSYASLEGHDQITLADVQRASRALNRQSLDMLAAQVNCSGNWNELAVSAQMDRELQNLVSRCRQRERLQGSVGAFLARQMNPGLRALFSGASGTGKTLAASLLAASLQKDLYRLDLSTLVNKYIGETEKNLSRVFSLAEELDVVLLLDEGDALLTQRTDVHSSNDRYANLETNYLLQRLEVFEGILIITTNASERIDRAFKRRMDVTIDFRAPEAAQRSTIWRLHLPATHSIHGEFLADVSLRCELNGGQIRNAVLYASSLALDNGGVVTSSHLEAAVQSEYRKAGSVCPLRSNGSNQPISHW